MDATDTRETEYFVTVGDWIQFLQGKISQLRSIELAFLSMMIATLLVIPTVIILNVHPGTIFGIDEFIVKLIFYFVEIIIVIFALMYAWKIITHAQNKFKKKRGKCDDLLEEILKGEISTPVEIRDSYFQKDQ